MTALRAHEHLAAYGADQLSDQDLVAIVVDSSSGGRTSHQVAAEVLARAGGLETLARAPVAELAAIPGIDVATATRIVAAFDLARRALSQRVRSDRTITCPADVFAHLQPRLSGLEHEVFVVLALDVRNRVLAELEVARGCLTGVDVHPREVFRPLIRRGAAAAVVAHNHPSGDTQPSSEDLALTRRLRDVGDLVGIPVLDHVVIGDTDYSSIVELEA